MALYFYLPAQSRGLALVDLSGTISRPLSGWRASGKPRLRMDSLSVFGRVSVMSMVNTKRTRSSQAAPCELSTVAAVHYVCAKRNGCVFIYSKHE